MFRMLCKCYVNSTFFKVGSKYLYVGSFNSFNGFPDDSDYRKAERIPLSKRLIRDLEQIKNEYRADDARRTINVIEVFNAYKEVYFS